MEKINCAKLEVLVTIDNRKREELIAHGFSDKDIQREIEKAITLTEMSLRAPVNAILSVELVKYY